MGGGGEAGVAAWCQDEAVKGGITALIKTAILAEAFHLNYELHEGGNSLNNSANLQVIVVIQNTELFGVLSPSRSHKHGLLEDIRINANRVVRAPCGRASGVDRLSAG